ncbi:MAG: histidine phosphatase family protein [Spirochaetales bacterium]|nr:histidine phosphatase family protein [Spirochaetales bacterium]
MKKLVVVRHAKADWGNDVKDFDRPLNKRGMKDAPRVARYLSEKGFSPDLMVTSPACRALSTSEAMAEVFDYPIERLEKNPALYLGAPSDLAEAMDFTPADVNTLYLVAHNPGVSHFASSLTGNHMVLSTCCAVICEGEGAWTDFRVVNWEMVRARDV